MSSLATAHPRSVVADQQDSDKTPRLPFVTLDVFTTTRYVGNPLAIVRVPDEKHVSTEKMQEIAREFNLSETIFLVDGKEAGDGVREWRVRIFLTDAEIPFAGHPTIGATVYALATLAHNASHGRLIANAGTIEVSYANGVATASIPHNVHVHTQYPFTVEDLNILQPALKGLVASGDAIATVSPVKGMNFVNIELPDLETLAKVWGTSPRPQPNLDDEWNVGFCGSYFYIFLGKPEKKGEVEVIQLRSRMIEGALEDPATGSAACALSSYLSLRRASSRKTFFQITQGVEMGRKSDIEVTITLDEGLSAVEMIELGGSAVKVMEGILEY